MKTDRSVDGVLSEIQRIWGTQAEEILADLANGSDWAEVAGRLSDDAPQRIVNAVALLSTLDGASDAAANMDGDDELLGAVVLQAFEAGWSAAYVDLDAALPDELDAILAKRRMRSVGSAVGGKNTAKLTDGEWDKVKAFIGKRESDGVSIAEACRQAEAQLRTGTFKGIDRAVLIGNSGLRKRWDKSNEPS